MLIRGRELLDPPYSLTKRAVYDLYVKGLQPYVETDPELTAFNEDPKARDGFMRVFPTVDQYKKYCTLIVHYRCTCSDSIEEIKCLEDELAQVCHFETLDEAWAFVENVLFDENEVHALVHSPDTSESCQTNKNSKEDNEAAKEPKTLHSTKWPNLCSKFLDFYHRGKEIDPSASDASIIKKAKVKYSSFKQIPDRTIRNWISPKKSID